MHGPPRCFQQQRGKGKERRRWGEEEEEEWRGGMMDKSEIEG